MVTAVTGIMGVLGSAGLSTATIQREDVTHKQVSTLFVANVGLGAILAVLCVLLGQLLSWFYDEPRLMGVTAALGLGFLFNGMTEQHLALIQRQMRFGALLVCRVVSNGIAAAAAISLAMAGFSYWSLVLRTIIEPAIMMTAVFIVMPWRPGLYLRLGHVRSLLRFGGYLTASRVVIFLSRNTDNVLLGRFFGSQSLGLYKKAYDLLLLPITRINGPLSTVVLPALSRLQDNPEKFRRFYTIALRLMVSFSAPLVVFCYASASDLVAVILGKQWVGAVPIFKALGPAAFVGTLNVAGSWILISLGNTRRQFKITLMIGSGVIVSFVVGLPYGPIGVAVAYSVASCVMRIPMFAYACKGTPIRLSTIGRAVVLPGIASALSGVTASFIGRAILESQPISIRLLSSAFVFFGTYLVVLLAPPWRTQFVDAFRMLKKKETHET